MEVRCLMLPVTSECIKALYHSCINRLRTTGTTYERSRLGRPRVTTRRDDAFIRLAHPRHQYKTPEEAARNLKGPNSKILCVRPVSNSLRGREIQRDGHT